ncbi:MAG: YeeE/YedE family protein [Spirochaetaceae bacterium]|nr:MAG: YeeE/YedE family protein [Spirochaetaceae bacterium]
MIATAGIALGLLLGFSLQRGGYCMNTAFRSFYLEKDRSLVRAWVLVLIINIIGVTLFTDLGILNPLVAPFFWPAAVIGGFVFGVGMVVAGGCASGTYYRCGRGMLGSIAALVGFVIGTALTDGGALTPLQQSLRGYTVTVGGGDATVFGLLGISSLWLRWGVILVLAAAAGLWLARSPKQKFLIGWSWQRTGLFVGLAAFAAWLLSAMQGREFGLSFTQPTVALTRFVIGGDSSGISVASFMVIGVPLGAFLAAKAAGEAVLRMPDPRRFVRQFGGGITMGLGASIAGGCNIGHSITGMSTLGLTAMVSTMFIILGCWAATGVIYRIEKKHMEEQMRLAMADIASGGETV